MSKLTKYGSCFAKIHHLDYIKLHTKYIWGDSHKTPFTGIQVRLTLSSNQQTDQKSVHSTRRCSNIKVPYQMSKLTKYGSCFAKMHHLDYIKLHTKYIWEDSPLTEDFKTLNFHNIVQSFKVSLVSTGSPAGVNRFWG